MISNHIKGITLDVGGTLIDPWPSVGDVYAEVAGRHGMDIPAELLNRRFRDAWTSLKDFDYTRAGWEQLVLRTFDGLTSKAMPESFFPALYERFAEAAVWRVFDDVPGTLDALKALNLRLAVLSNWDERLPGLLARLHLREYFDVVVVSCEVGFAKPSPVIFEHAARQLGMKPESILHVGDSRRMDVDGALSAGFQALHLRRGSQQTAEGEIQSLAELTCGLSETISGVKAF